MKVTQSCPTLCDPIDYTIHGILQARILEWVAVLFSRGSSQLRDWTKVFCITGRFFIVWVTREAFFLILFFLQWCQLRNLALLPLCLCLQGLLPALVQAQWTHGYQEAGQEASSAHLYSNHLLQFTTYKQNIHIHTCIPNKLCPIQLEFITQFVKKGTIKVVTKNVWANPG